MEEWTVWGDDPVPVITGTEDQCKNYVEERPDDLALYVSDPYGNEYEFYNGSWRKT